MDPWETGPWPLGSWETGPAQRAEQQTELAPPEADAGRLFSSRLVKTVNPHLDFRGDASEACEFYRGVFRGEFSYLPTIRDGGGDTPGVAEAELDWVRYVALPLTYCWRVPDGQRHDLLVGGRLRHRQQPLHLDRD